MNATTTRMAWRCAALIPSLVPSPGTLSLGLPGMLSLGLLSLAGLSLSGPAHAGIGPWVLSPGDLSAYAGSRYERYTTMAHDDGATTPIIGEGVVDLGAVVVLGAGLVPGVEGELLVPWVTSRVLQPQSERCDNLSLEGCKPSAGIDVIRARLKVALMDEWYGAPFSLTSGLELRYGEMGAQTRARLTSLGDGTSDVGGYLALGRAAEMGSRSIDSAMEIGARYRFPNGTQSGYAIPGSELFACVEILPALSSVLHLGVTADALVRPGGLALEEIDYDSVDRYASLAARTVRVGGKALLQVNTSWSVIFSGGRTVYARNNPVDALDLGFGLSWYRPQPTEGAP